MCLRSKGRWNTYVCRIGIVVASTEYIGAGILIIQAGVDRAERPVRIFHSSAHSPIHSLTPSYGSLRGLNNITYIP